MAVSLGDVLWTPPADVRTTTQVGRFMDFAAQRGVDLPDYDAALRWSVEDLEGFWGAIWDFFGVRSHTPYERVLSAPVLPGARWFEGATLNYAEHMVGLDEDTDRVAIVARSQSRDPFEVTFGELRDQVARARAGLERLGVGPGDRVVAYLPNIPETLVAFLATASLGAVWATCAPEFGARCGDRPLRHRRADRPARGRRLRLRGQARRPPRRGRRDPGGARHDRARRPRALRGRRQRRLAGGDRLGRPPGRARAAALRPRAVRPPAVRSVLVRHDRAAQADRPRPRRDPRRGPQEPRPELGPAARRPPAVVLDDRVDDVERAGRRRSCTGPRS